MPADRGEPPFRGGRASGGILFWQAPAPDESKAEHIQAEHPVRPQADAPKNNNQKIEPVKSGLYKKDKECG